MQFADPAHDLRFHGAKVILLIGGYDKGADPSERRQQREILQARPGWTA